MKRFTFRFHRVLMLKERLEDAAKAALGEAQTVLDEERRVLAELELVRRLSLETARRNRVAGLDPSLLGLHAMYLQRLEAEIAAQRRKVAQAQAVVEKRRVELVEARRQRRTYEILRDRAWEDHQRQVLRKEHLHLDEAGEILHVRRGREAEEWSDGETTHARG